MIALNMSGVRIRLGGAKLLCSRFYLKYSYTFCFFLWDLVNKNLLPLFENMSGMFVCMSFTDI